MQLATKISVYQPTILYVFLNADTAIEDIIDVLETLSRKYLHNLLYLI
jgi:hypothetical protein